ncbi:MAG: T9SS type A sorting domain-containing protein [Ignavibacteria bacterium]|nr:T9SS type A sorting domain-containing protein [Ignavibacteria bacterium]
MKKIFLSNIIFTGLILLVFLNSLIISQTTYIWVGSVNSSFSNGGNWSPYRQIGRATDRLVFNNGQNITISGLNQITFAQMVIRDNTNVTFIPGSGNARIIFIEGELSDAPNGRNERVIADLKYNEYNIEEKVKDIATLKYKEYGITEETKKTDLATLKYSEYNNPPASGMGDLKVNTDPMYNPNNSNVYIENGSSFRINASDPSLSILLKQNAKAEIYGTFVLEGQMHNSFNSNDPYSIYFKPGSKLIQKCPGNVFNSTGAPNSVVFESGSAIEIQNSAALSPFAMESPYSKMVLDEGSKFIMSAPGSTALRLSGRNYSILEINCIMNLNEIIISDCYIKDLIINPAASLTINNLNYANPVPYIKLRGDLIANGNLVFPENTTSNINISIEGTQLQKISGSGTAEFNSSLNKMVISNNVNLNRDLSVNCNVIHNNGNLNCTQHTFTIFGNFISPFSLPPGVIIQNNNYRKSKEEPVPDNSRPVIQAKLIPEPLPVVFSLGQNYPNPFNPETTIEYAIPVESIVTLKVYDVSGKEIMVLSDGLQKAGNYKRDFNGIALSSGIYFYRITAKNGNDIFIKSNKMILAK